jgi:hypothetical protein
MGITGYDNLFEKIFKRTPSPTGEGQYLDVVLRVLVRFMNSLAPMGHGGTMDKEGFPLLFYSVCR